MTLKSIVPATELVPISSNLTQTTTDSVVTDSVLIQSNHDLTLDDFECITLDDIGLMMSKSMQISDDPTILEISYSVTLTESTLEDITINLSLGPYIHLNSIDWTSFSVSCVIFNNGKCCDLCSFLRTPGAPPTSIMNTFSHYVLPKPIGDTKVTPRDLRVESHPLYMTKSDLFYSPSEDWRRTSNFRNQLQPFNHDLRVIIDSGSSLNTISHLLVITLGLYVHPYSTPHKAS